MTEPPRPALLGPKVQHWRVAKPSSRGEGVVVSQMREAAEIGAEVLRDGGTAADAAVASAFALAVLEPWNSGLGGIAFAVVHDPAEGTFTLDTGPRAPGRVNPADYPIVGPPVDALFAWPAVLGGRNEHGPMSVVAPAAPSGYGALAERFGRLPWGRLVEPAIALARDGHAVDWWTTQKVAASAAQLRLDPTAASVWLPDGLPPVPPTSARPLRLDLGRLADTLERIAQAGVSDLRTGDIATALAADVAAAGGVLDNVDLAAVEPVWRESLKLPWQDGVLHAASGLTAGPTLARVLDRMEGQWQRDAGFHARLARALFESYEERLAGMGELARAAETCTTHITAVDRNGQAVALTTTLLSSFGSKWVSPSTGILMNNGMFWFDPTPGSPNGIAPHRRPICNMCPVVLTRDGRAVLAAGASGGRRILPAVLQVLTFADRFGMGAHEAAHEPRIDVSGGACVTVDARLNADAVSAIAETLPVELVEHVASPAQFACPNLAMRQADGSWIGVADAMSPKSGSAAT